MSRSSRFARRFAFMMLLCASTLAGQTSITVEVSRRLGSASIIRNHVAVQGLPFDYDDASEGRLWRDLDLRTEGLILIADEDYNQGSIRVFRCGQPDCRRSGWIGPVGPMGDLYLETAAFDLELDRLRNRLGLTPQTLAVSLGVTPRALSLDPAAPDYMHLSPARDEEWRAVVSTALTHLAGRGFTAPTLFGPGTEPESFFRGRNRERGTLAAGRDWSELFVQSHRAVKAANAAARLIGPGNAAYSSTISGRWGIDHAIAHIREIDPSLRLDGVSWQGYYFGGLESYGPARLMSGVEFVAALLESHGYSRTLPQYLLGWNPTFANLEFDDTALTGSQRTAFHRAGLDLTATHLITEVLRFTDPASERLLDTAYFYTWNGDVSPECRASFSVGTMVSSIHEGGDADDGLSPGCRYLPSQVGCPRASYEAMKFLLELSHGEFLEVSRAPDIRAAAVSKPGRVEVLIGHEKVKPLSGARVVVRGLRPGDHYEIGLRTVASGANLCAIVTDQQAGRVRVDGQGSIMVVLPDSAHVHVTLKNVSGRRRASRTL